MLNKLSDIFRSDEFIPASAVFPDIDKERLASDLDLKGEGRERGEVNQPETSSKSLDHIELKAVARVEELRRRGLDNYETNRRVYSERLNLAVSARMQVETEANDSKARFKEEVTKWNAMMVTPRERVQEAFAWRKDFREKNGLARPAKEVTGWPKLIAISLILILGESLMNAYLFSQKNPLGYMGGWLAAVMVSLINVGASSLLGSGARFINCRGFRNTLKKMFGLIFAAMWLSFATGYNLAVAHFRDAVEMIGDWREAGIAALTTLRENTIQLHTMESYALLTLGFLISVAAFLKGYSSSDPYPGYSKVSQSVVKARENYSDHLSESIEELGAHCDEAVENLRLANEEVHRHVNDSVDALYGQKALQANLSPFLEQCDIAANYLLAVYRDANKSAREEAPPAYFNKHFAFEKFEPATADEVRRSEAEAQVKEVSEMVNNAIKEIFEVFNEAVNSHYEIDELEGTHIERKRHDLKKENAAESSSGLKIVPGDASKETA